MCARRRKDQEIIDTVVNVKARVKARMARREGSKNDIRTSESEKKNSQEKYESDEGKWKTLIIQKPP